MSKTDLIYKLHQSPPLDTMDPAFSEKQTKVLSFTISELRRDWRRAIRAGDAGIEERIDALESLVEALTLRVAELEFGKLQMFRPHQKKSKRAVSHARAAG
jgi:hypothetical protein